MEFSVAFTSINTGQEEIRRPLDKFFIFEKETEGTSAPCPFKNNPGGLF